MIELKEHETAALIKESSRDRYVALSFGPRGVFLNEKQAPWAAELVKKWRAGADERQHSDVASTSQR